MSTDRPRAKGGAHATENPAISYYMDKLGEDETNPGDYYLTLNIYRQVMEWGWGSGNRRRAAPMVSPKHAQSRIIDVPVFAAVAAAESSALDTKHLVQRWTVNLLSTKYNRHNNDFKR